MPILALILIATILGVAVAVWSTTQPVHNTIIIVGTRGFTAYNSSAYLETELFSGAYNYGENAKTNASIPAPQAIYLKNTGEMPLKVSWNATGMPTGLTVSGEKFDGVNWLAFNANGPITLNSGGTLTVRFNLATNNVAFGTFNWDTVIWAVQA